MAAWGVIFHLITNNVYNCLDFCFSPAGQLLPVGCKPKPPTYLLSPNPSHRPTCWVQTPATILPVGCKQQLPTYLLGVNPSHQPNCWVQTPATNLLSLWNPHPGECQPVKAKLVLPTEVQWVFSVTIAAYWRPPDPPPGASPPQQPDGVTVLPQLPNDASVLREINVPEHPQELVLTSTLIWHQEKSQNVLVDAIFKLDDKKEELDKVL